jgi:RHS repeat-associated protein
MSYVIGDEVLAQCGSTATMPSYFLPDGHANNRQLTQLNGTVSSRYNYDAYGLVQSATSSSTAESAPTTKLYCGEQYDANLHMYNLRARYYDPSNGRFNARDTFAGNKYDPQSLHKYLYASCNPVNVVDPSGNQGLIDLEVSAAISAIIDVVECSEIVGAFKAVEDALFPAPVLTPDQVPTFRKQLAHLCKDVYGPPKGYGLWQRADLTKIGLQNATFSSGSFFSQLYSDNGAYVLAFRGTESWGDPGFWGDWWSNLAQGALGPFFTQYDEATSLADQVNAAVGSGAALTMTGHSLGGGLAAAAGIETDRPAVTFNAAGLNGLTYLVDNGLFYTSSTVNYSVQGEILTTIQHHTLAPEAFGQQYMLKPGPNYTGAGPITLHGISSVLDALGE